MNVENTIEFSIQQQQNCRRCPLGVYSGGGIVCTAAQLANFLEVTNLSVEAINKKIEMTSRYPNMNIPEGCGNGYRSNL